MLIGANKRQDKVRLDNIAHDIAVLDTAIYFSKKYNIAFGNIITDKQLRALSKKHLLLMLRDSEKELWQTKNLLLSYQAMFQPRQPLSVV